MNALAAARAMGMRVVPAARLDPEEWDLWVRRCPKTTFCHASAWAGVMADALGHESCSRVALDADGKIAGILPLVRVRSRLFGHYLVSMPFLNYGGPLGDEGARRVLAQHAREEAERGRVDLLELRDRRFGYVFQQYALFPHLSVEQNLGYGIAHLGTRGPHHPRTDHERCRQTRR